MPDLGEVKSMIDKSKDLTLEDYFAGLNNLYEDSDKASNKQIGGTHYQKSIQPWDIIDELGLDYYEGNVLKYLLRWRDKDGVRDLKKAQHYLQKMIERETNNG